MKRGYNFLLLAALACLISASVQAAILDDFNSGTFNAGAHWTLNQVTQSTNPSDVITYDQTENPGLLTITYDDTQGNDQTTLTTWSPDTLDVDEFLQVKVRLLQGSGVNVRVGLALATSTTPGTRANVLYFGLRGDGVARAHAYMDGGNEFNDPGVAIAGYVAGDVLTLKILRSSLLDYQLFYGRNGDATTFVGTVSWPSTGGTAPTVPAILMDNGLSDFKATVEDFEISAATAEPTPTPTPTPTPRPTPPPPNVDVDLFNTGQFSPAWNTQNYPERQGGLDTITTAQSGGKLLVTMDDTQGSVEADFFLRNDVTLEPGETVQVDVRVVSSAADPILVRAGLGLAAVTSGIDANRSNTIWYGLRNDGIMRGNGYDSTGAEIGDVAPALPGYVPGTDIITCLIFRESTYLYSCWYSVNGGELTMAGEMNMNNSTAPYVPGLFFGLGTADLQFEFDNFKMYKLTLPNQSKNWEVYE